MLDIFAAVIVGGGLMAWGIRALIRARGRAYIKTILQQMHADRVAEIARARREVAALDRMYAGSHTKDAA